MGKIFKNKILLVASIFIGILVLIFLTIYIIGKAYQGGLDSLQQTPQQVKVIPKKTIRKITIKKLDSTECLEVTPDGAVRKYATCGGELTSAHRPGDPTNVYKLYNLIGDRDLSKYKIKKDGSLYEITVETDTGTETYYLPADGDNGAADIIVVIADLQTSLIPSPTPSNSTPRPTASVLLPSGISVGPTPTPTATGGEQQTFTCGFTEQNNKKPVYVSNVICSTQPASP